MCQLVDLKTLVLNADMQPLSVVPSLSVIPVQNAIVMVLKGTVTPVKNYDRKIQASVDMYCPSIIALKEYHKIHKRGVPLNKTSLFYRDGGICAYCGKELSSTNIVTKDHVIPKKLGGKTEWNNIVCSCSECNVNKGDKIPEGMWKPKITPYMPTIGHIRKNRKRFPITIQPEWKEFFNDWNVQYKENLKNNE